MADITAVEKKVENSVKVIEVESKEFERLEQKHQINSGILSKIEHVDVVQSVNQSRQITLFVENHNAWLELNKRLKQLNDDEVNTAEFELQKALADSKKYMDGVRGERKDEYDDLLRQIQKLAKKVGEDTDDLNKRLNDFEAELLQPDGTSDHISDADLIFLKKEVTRYRSALQSVKSNKDHHLSASQQVNNEVMKSRIPDIQLGDVQALRQHFKALEKLQGTDVPRIRRNIDQLEAFSLKALKNQLNDDNKKSQNQISKMKKNYEDLQKQIDTLNLKITKVQGEVDGLKEQFTNEDLERINEIQSSLDDKLNECDRDVNGDKAERDRSTADRSSRGLENEKVRSL